VVKAKTTKVPNKLIEADFQHCFDQWKIFIGAKYGKESTLKVISFVM